MQHGRFRSSELIPALAPQTFGWDVVLSKHFDRQWMHLAGRMTARAVTTEFVAANGPMVDGGFGQDRPGRITRAEEEDVKPAWLPASHR